MSGANVNLGGLPLTRLNPWYPGQFGVPGTDNETGLRQHCTGTIFYVDPNYPGASDARDGTNPTDPLLTVAAAITKVQPQRGDVIVVMQNDDWFYAPGGQGVSTDYTIQIAEEVTIPYTASGVRIIGVSSSPLGVMWQPISNGGTCITVHAIDVVIEGFVFTEGAALTGCNAISAVWDGVTMFGENLVVRNCYFDGTVDICIQLEYTWYCDIHNNVFMQCDTHGVYIDPDGAGADYLRVHNNGFYNVGVGAGGAITLEGTNPTEGVLSAAIFQNWIFNEDAAGGVAATDEGINLTNGRDNMVHDNWLGCALTGGGAGDYDDLNTAGVGDAWVNNHCMNGDAITNAA